MVYEWDDKEKDFQRGKKRRCEERSYASCVDVGNGRNRPVAVAAARDNHCTQSGLRSERGKECGWNSFKGTEADYDGNGALVKAQTSDRIERR